MTDPYAFLPDVPGFTLTSSSVRGGQPLPLAQLSGMFGVPASVTELAEDAGAPDTRVLPAGAFQLGADAGARQYVGGAPPAGTGVHEYHLTVTALDVDTAGLDESASAAFLGFAIGGHTLARATLVCPTPAPAA